MGGRAVLYLEEAQFFNEAFDFVATPEPKWNQIKRELITMWQIVNKVLRESPVTV